MIKGSQTIIKETENKSEKVDSLADKLLLK